MKRGEEKRVGVERGGRGKEKNAKEGKKEVGEEKGNSKVREREGRKGEMKRIRDKAEPGRIEREREQRKGGEGKRNDWLNSTPAVFC